MGKTKVEPKTEYEITLLLKPDVTKADVLDEDDRVNTHFVVRNKSEHPAFVLPYKHQGYEEAYRLEYDAVQRCENLNLSFFSHLLNVDDNVLRYLIVTKHRR